MSRARRLNFRVSDDEFERLEAEANRQGVSMADIFRAWVHRLPKPKNPEQSIRGTSSPPN